MYPLHCSIIISTYNRLAHLEKLLAACHHLNYESFEVIVVNGPSTDGTAALLAEYKDIIKIVNCSVAHMTRSRNLGLAAAVGDIVIFIDDDARPASPEWLAQIAQIFQADSAGQIGAVGGPVYHYDTDYYQFKGGIISDYNLQVFWVEQRQGQLVDGQRWAQRSMGCNSAFRRSALLEIGGFDENINYYADEGDVCLRLVRQGYQVIQPEDCAVRHYPAQSSQFGHPFLRNRRIITQDDTYFCLKNGADNSVKRFFKTLWLAPTKHFVKEMPRHWRKGQLSTGALLYFFSWQWLWGVCMGLVLGLFRPRGLQFNLPSPSPFLPFIKNQPGQKLRICLITEYVPPYPKIGGVERYTYDLAKGLHRLGHEVHVICRNETVIRQDSLAFTLHGIPPSAYKEKILFPGKRALNNCVGYALAVGHKLIELNQQGVSFDVVHATNWNLCGLTLPIIQIYPYVLVLVSPLIEIIETQGWPYRDDLHACVALDRWQIEQAMSLCCPSWGVMECYQTKMGLTLEELPIKKVQLGIVPTPQAEVVPTGSRLHRLLFVGRLEYRKGAHILLEILPELLTTHPDWQCDLVGDDQVRDTDGLTFKKKFLAKHSQAPWLNRVCFHGTVSDESLQKFYQSCDLFVAPSLFESFGLIYPEAMQYGKAVVGCETAGIPEIVTDGIDGVLVEPNDPAALRAALDHLMRNPSLREKLGQAGRRKVEQELNHLAMARRMLNRYYEAIAQHRETLTQATLIEFNQLEQKGEWNITEVGAGQAYLMTSQPGASLQFELPGQGLLTLVSLRHEESGVLMITIGQQAPVYVDLYSAQPALSTVCQLDIVGQPEDRIRVQLTVHPERNPASKNTQAWLKQLFFKPVPHL